MDWKWFLQTSGRGRESRKSSRESWASKHMGNVGGKIFRFKLALALIILLSVSVLSSQGNLAPTLIPLSNQPSGLAIFGASLYVTTDVSSDNFFSVFESDGEGNLSPVGPENTSTGSGAYNPMGAMVASGSTLYGTGSQGSSDADGCVFAVNTDGSDFAVLHTFEGSDGSDPQDGLILSDGILYGTTSGGGINSVGTVFAISTDGNFTNIYSFNSGSGANPQGALVLSGNTLYGTTSTGGSNGDGTVFAVHTDGTGYTNLYTFNATRVNGDGANPQAGLFLSANTLYGTTFAGGSNNDGTIFAINTDGKEYKVLHAFNGSDGYNPQCMPVLVGDTLYGVTSNSTSHGCIFFGLNTNGLGFTNMDSGFVTGLAGGLVALPDTTGTTLLGMGAAYGSIPVVFAFTVPTIETPNLTMTITYSGNRIIVSWADTGSYTLQQNSSLDAAGGWTTSSYTVSTANGTNSVTIKPSSGNLFFRLVNP